MLNSFLFISVIFFQLFGLLASHEDEDTEFINTSFKDEIKDLHSAGKKCQVKSGSDWITPTENYGPKREIPTCLKDFYEIAHVPICGKPMYNKFKQCANARFHYAKQEMPHLILVLFDGCVWCPQWPERGMNVSISIKFKRWEQKANAKSDRYGDFKIGAIYNLETDGRWRFPFTLTFTHTCNQYNKLQEKIFEFHVDVYKMTENVYARTNFEVMLPQGTDEKKTVKA